MRIIIASIRAVFVHTKANVSERFDSIHNEAFRFVLTSVRAVKALCGWHEFEWKSLQSKAKNQCLCLIIICGVKTDSEDFKVKNNYYEFRCARFGTFHSMLF